MTKDSEEIHELRCKYNGEICLKMESDLVNPVLKERTERTEGIEWVCLTFSNDERACLRAEILWGGL